MVGFKFLETLGSLGVVLKHLLKSLFVFCVTTGFCTHADTRLRSAAGSLAEQRLWRRCMGNTAGSVSHALLLPFPVRGRSFLQDSRAGVTTRTAAPLPVECGSLDAGWR